MAERSTGRRLKRPDRCLDLVRDVRDDLHGAAEVVASALLLDDGAVHLPGRDVVVAGHAGRGEALVVPEVEVGLAAVVGDEDLAVLIRAHGAGIDVDVGIHLLQRHAQAPRLEERSDRGGGQALAQRGHDASGHEDEFRGHLRPPFESGSLPEP